MNQLVFGISLSMYLACLYAIITSHSYREPFIGMVLSVLIIIGCGIVSIFKSELSNDV